MKGLLTWARTGSFGEGVGDFGPRDDVGLADRLEGVDSSGVLLATCMPK